VPPQGGRKHPEQQYIQMDTTNILFICGGTFVGIDDIIRRRLGKRTLGFGQASGFNNEQTQGEVLEQVTTEDVLEFGLIPELVGRLPVASALKPLDEKGLIKCLTEPRNALLKQYEHLFEMEGCKIGFTEDALAAIAKKALKKGTGARGLRSIVEEAMLDIMFELPEQAEGTSFMIDSEVVEGRKKLFPTTTPAAA
jgi:ATP-dependent Clp protease ATP-binding subunit ClpX